MLCLDNKGIVHYMGMFSGVSVPLIKYTTWTTTTPSGYVTDGVELVNNGDFEDGLNNWLPTTSTPIYITLEGGVATIEQSSANGGQFSNKLTEVSVGDTLLLSVEVSNFISAGRLYYRDDSGYGVRVDVTADGTYQWVDTVKNVDNSRILAYSIGTTGFSIDNVSVQKVIQEPNKRYITDEGKSPKYPLALYSGSGKKFNGTNQYVPFSTNTRNDVGCFGCVVSQTSILALKVVMGTSSPKREYIAIDNGEYFLGLANDYIATDVLHNQFDNIKVNYINGIYEMFINGNSVKVGTYTGTIVGIQNYYIGSSNGNGFMFNGIVKDVYRFDRALTPVEIVKNYKQPEQFYIDALADNACVLNMPMCDTDNMVRDMARYSESVELNPNPTFDGASSYIGTVGTGINRVNISNVGARYWSDGTNTYLVPSPVFDITGKTVIAKIVVSEYVSGTLKIEYNEGSTYKNLEIDSVGTYYFIWNATTNKSTLGRLTACDITVSEFSVKVIESGIYPILNHTVDTNVNNLQYGTQNLKLPMDILGKRDGYITPWVKGDGISYGDTGWVPPTDSDWSIEIVSFIPSTEDYVETTGVASGGGVDASKIRFYIGAGGKPHCWVGEKYSTLTGISNEYLHWLFVYDSVNNSYTMYWNGETILTSFRSDVNLLQSSETFKLNNYYSGISNRGTNIIKLCKVHDKALTQEEVTIAYNNVVKKGLLI